MTPVLRRIARLVVLSGLLFSGMASAEGGCPPGMVPFRPNDMTSCAPIPQGYPGHIPTQAELPPPPPPPPELLMRDRWGAIAIDATGTAFGASNDRVSEDGALEAAVKDCEFYGGVGCKGTRTYRNECLAVATSNEGDGYGKGSLEDVAINIAMDNCKKNSHSECKTTYAACSRPASTWVQ